MLYEINLQRFSIVLRASIKKKGFTIKQFVIGELHMSMNGFYCSLKNGSIMFKTILEICKILEIHPASLFLHEDEVYSWNLLFKKYAECKTENKQLKKN